MAQVGWCPYCGTQWPVLNEDGSYTCKQVNCPQQLFTVVVPPVE